MNKYVLIVLLITSLATSNVVYAQTTATVPASAKNNPKDVCKVGKNAENVTQSITYCIDSTTKKRYIPKPVPEITTDGIFLAGKGNATDLVFMNDPATSSLNDANMSIASIVTGTPLTKTHLIPISINYICKANGDKKCELAQNNFVTQNLTTTIDAAKNWNIAGGVEYIGPQSVSNLKVTANFYDAKGLPIGGLVSVDLPHMTGGDTAQFSMKTVKSNPKILPVYLVISYHGTVIPDPFATPINFSAPLPSVAPPSISPANNGQ